MIIQTFRIRTAAGVGRFLNHVARGADNEEIIAVRGVDDDLTDMFKDARDRGREYAVRHIVIAPGEGKNMSIEAMLGVLDKVVREFGLNDARTYIRVHLKHRVIETAYEYHLHAILPDFDDERVSDNRHNRRRQEKLAREAELQHGHDLVHGGHHQWVVNAFRREGKHDAAAALEAAFPADAPRARASLRLTTIQALKRAGLSASLLRETVRTAWRETATDEEFSKRLAASQMTVQRGTGDPPIWIVTVDVKSPDTGAESRLFLCTLAGAMPGIRHVEINNRLGDPNVERALEPPGLAALLHAPEADEPGRAGRADAADDEQQARPLAGPAGGGRDAERRGSATRYAEADFGGRQDVAGGDHAVDRFLPQPDERGSVERNPEWTPAEAAQLNARLAQVEEIHDLAILAAEPPRDRIEREITDIEANALAKIVSGNQPLPEPRYLLRARSNYETVLDRLERGLQRRKEVEEALQRVEARIEAAPFWRKADDLAERRARLEDRLFDLMLFVDRQRSRVPLAVERIDAAEAAFRKTQADRQDSIKVYELNLDLVRHVRNILATKPMMASHGTLTLLMLAHATVEGYDWQAKDIWGIPIAPPPRRTIV